MKCPVCNSVDIEDYLKEKIPIFILPVPEKLAKKVKIENIHLKICKMCSHIFQTDINKEQIELIYNEFYENYTQDVSEYTKAIYEKRFMDFFGKNGNKGKKLLDIGCGVGALFPFFEKQGMQGFGIDPSKNIDILKKNNPNIMVFTDFFERNNHNVFETKFDFIIMRNLLEHIINFELFFDVLKHYVKKGTKIYIEVPDIEYYLKNSVPLFYTHEHINYFTPFTLKILLEKKGFNVIKQLNGDAPSFIMCGEYTGITNSKKKHNENEFNVKKQFVEEINELQIKMEELFAKESHIILYGIGLTAVWIINFCLDKTSAKIEIIDDNENYHGKVIQGVGEKLEIMPKIGNLNNALIVITTSPVYHEKIEEKIKEIFTGTYKIGYIKNKNINVKVIKNVK